MQGYRGVGTLQICLYTLEVLGAELSPRKGAWCQQMVFFQFLASVLCGSEPGLVSEYIRSSERGSFMPPTLLRMS